jgi:hypothetical protein
MNLKVKDLVDSLYGSSESLPSRDDIMRALNLMPSRGVTDQIAPAIGIFTVGVMLGAGLAMLLAPKTGAEMRHAIGERVNEFREGIAPREQHEYGAPSHST